MSWYLVIPFVFMILAFLIKMPIGWGMLSGSVVYFLVRGISLEVVVNTAGYGIYSSYILIAIPLFVFMANVMNSSKITDYIYDFAHGLVGRFRGGSGYVNILGSLIFSGMTGSALADASGLGTIEIDRMNREGYDTGFSCALTAATAVIGPTFPPSIPFVVFAMLSGASVGKLFIGGIIPALIECVTLGLYVFYISNKRNYPKGVQVGLKSFLLQTLKAVPALITPIILLVGIYTGISTPTEAGAVGSAYAVIISFLVYRTLDLQSLKKILYNTIVSTGSIFLVVAAAYSFSYIISIERVDQWLLTVMDGVTASQFIFLLIVNVIFLILGCLIDVNVTQLVFVPIFIPMAKALGIDMVHFGVMICLNMMIGLATPPFGMLLFISSSIGKASMKDVIREIMPMLIMLLVGLLIVTYVPESVLFLPNMMK